MYKTLVIVGRLILVCVATDVCIAQQSTASGTPVVPCGKADEYCVNRASSNGWCKVQQAKDAQMYGPTLAGSFKTKALATAEMCRRYEAASPDLDKCSDVLPTGVCDKTSEKEKHKEK
jgi:hypothetical protein